VAVAGVSGGDSVASADAFAEAGLNLPPLSRASIEELDTFFNLVGAGYSNPIDTANPNGLQMKRIMDILVKDRNIDNLVMVISTRPGMHPFENMVKNSFGLMEEIREKTTKPVMAIIYFTNPEGVQEARVWIKKCQEIGIPAFPSISRAAIALRNALRYYCLKSKIGE
jgi:acyl-CoA synthetase (NDP forming)